MGKEKFGRGSARGARGGEKSMEMSENTYFTAVHSSAALFRISYGMHYSGALARASRARSGAPWVTKFGKLSIR